jgi:hypothetical protein
MAGWSQSQTPTQHIETPVVDENVVLTPCATTGDTDDTDAQVCRDSCVGFHCFAPKI